MKELTTQETSSISGGIFLRVLRILATEMAFSTPGPNRYTGEFHG
jgi:bacteriocin-like protein